MATSLFTGATNSEWYNPGNWSGGIPDSTTDVVFDATSPDCHLDNATFGNGEFRTIDCTGYTGTWTQSGARFSLLANGNATFASTMTGTVGLIVMSGTCILTTGGFAIDLIAVNGGALQFGATASITAALNGNGGDINFAGQSVVVGGSGIALAAGNISGLNGATLNTTDFSSTVDLIGSGEWFLVASGTSVAHVVTITNCNASLGVELDATDSCTNGGGNTNVLFAVPTTTSTTTTVPPIVLCPDCPSTSTTPPTCPDPPDSANCCLQVRYTCDAGVWTLASAECVDNALCSTFIQTCSGTEFYYEMQNGCVCFDVPVAVCEPPDVDCDCPVGPTTTTPPPTTTTTTAPPTTTTTPPPTTTTTTLPGGCPAGEPGSWDFSVNQSQFGVVSPAFEIIPACPGNNNCCYLLSISIEGTISSAGSNGVRYHFTATGPAGGASDCVTGLVQFSMDISQNTPINQPISQTTNMYMCGSTSPTLISGFTITVSVPGGSDTMSANGTISWTVSYFGTPCF